MIFASFEYNFVRAAVGNTNLLQTITLNFNALYQNADHLVVLGYACLTGQRHDAGGASLQDGTQYAVRLIGNFNESHNVPATIDVPRAGDSIVNFSGIVFTSYNPFYAPPNARILMPPTFQVEFDPGSTTQAAAGDSIRILCTIGYEIIMKN